MIALEVTYPSTRPTGLSTELLSIASSVPIGTRGKVYVWGRNDMATKQRLAISWIVKDPDGVVVEDYGPDWTFEYVNYNEDHRFYGDRFDLNKEGTYTMAIKLFMNQASPVVVDSYEGDLCTTTLEVPPEFDLIEETIYPYAYIYDGPSEVGTFTFTTIPFTPASWISGRMASLVEDEVRKSGGRIMEMRVYVDESQWRPWTNWRIDVITKPPGTTAGTAMPLGITWWAVAILAVLAIILIIVITWSAKQIAGIFERYPDLKDVKPGWGKETLMLTIHDSEEYWERPLTPTETLDGMSEAELRDYLDKIAEEEVKPALPDWLPWAIIGGVVVVGGGVAALALTAKRE